MRRGCEKRTHRPSTPINEKGIGLPAIFMEIYNQLPRSVVRNPFARGRFRSHFTRMNANKKRSVGECNFLLTLKRHKYSYKHKEMRQDRIFRRRRSHTSAAEAVHPLVWAVIRRFPVVYPRRVGRVPDWNEPRTRQRRAAYPTPPSRLPVVGLSRRRTDSSLRDFAPSSPCRIRIVTLVPCASAPRAPLR